MQQADVPLYIYKLEHFTFPHPERGHENYIPYYNFCLVKSSEYNSGYPIENFYSLISASDGTLIKIEIDPSIYSLLFYRDNNQPVFEGPHEPFSSSVHILDINMTHLSSDTGISDPNIYIGENGIASDNIELKPITDSFTNALIDKLKNVVEEIEDQTYELFNENNLDADGKTEISKGLENISTQLYEQTLETLSQSLSASVSRSVSRTNSQNSQSNIFNFGSQSSHTPATIKAAIKSQIPIKGINEIVETSFKNVVLDENVFGLGAEVIDFTFSKAFFRSKESHEILERNNRFGILKFACANGIPIIDKTNIIQTDKIHYFIQELAWMMEGDAGSAKGSTRKIRFDALTECLKSPKAIELFNEIYNLMCNKRDNIKICAVGGNVIRAFFLALKTSDDPELKELSKHLSGHFRLDFLCSKASDADFTGFELMSDAELAEYGPAFMEALQILVNGGVCLGKIEFPLIRLKLKVPADAMTFQECGKISDKSQTIKDAKYFYPQMNWFPQLIDDRYNYAAFQHEIQPQERGITSQKMYEINKLECVMLKSKRLNAKMTKDVAEIIAGGMTDEEKYNSLMVFVRLCCEYFCQTIDAGISKLSDKSIIYRDIESIVNYITPLACEALIKIMNNTDILKKLKEISDAFNENTLMRPSVDDKTGELDYSNSIIVSRSSDGTPKWSKSTSIAIGNSNLPETISNMNKKCSKQIREILFSHYPLSTKFSITINTLSFDSALLSPEDLINAELAASETVNAAASESMVASSLSSSGGPPESRFASSSSSSALQDPFASALASSGSSYIPQFNYMTHSSQINPHARAGPGPGPGFGFGFGSRSVFGFGGKSLKKRRKIKKTKRTNPRKTKQRKQPKQKISKKRSKK